LRSFAPFAVNKVLAMPFIPHTEEDVSVMLGAIGAKSIEDLFDEIPPALKTGKLKGRSRRPAGNGGVAADASARGAGRHAAVLHRRRRL
jgi:glycine cleavage system pyridoxal-binding protein P